MAQIVEAVNEIYNIDKSLSKKLFLAGGITSCPDWQSEIIEMIKDLPNLIVYNPRRKDFPINDPNSAEVQISWEYEHLRDADIISFWFSEGSLNPIVLYELGRWGNSSNKEIVIGIDPKYERKKDVIIQTKLSRPDVKIVDSLEELSEEIKNILIH
ncbi:MAG TPA: nucleoside 2-deoxyribosyltransferase domain-containing protein, partial [Candidatus Diapherotrites archaeon]|nr:nucleoside 2-deoxyribosyltransferase domain-containing protein [Candidatus Diapherotrites archaeon]